MIQNADAPKMSILSTDDDDDDDETIHFGITLLDNAIARFVSEPSC